MARIIRDAGNFRLRKFFGQREAEWYTRKHVAEVHFPK
jgi:hypothetical protein